MQGPTGLRFSSTQSHTPDGLHCNPLSPALQSISAGFGRNPLPGRDLIRCTPALQSIAEPVTPLTPATNSRTDAPKHAEAEHQTLLDTPPACGDGRRPVRVAPKRDSHLEIAMATAEGVRRVEVNGYIGPGVTADSRVVLDANGIRSSTLDYR
jgi:hypothetical protein